MPSSTPRILEMTVHEILKSNPRRVLEAGIGNGRNAFLIREYIECWQDRVFPEDWLVRIEGIEIFEPYTELPHVQELYNKIIVGDIYEELPKLEKAYDFTICTDVLEHLDKDKGLACAGYLIDLTTKRCVINVPTGEDWMNNVVIADNDAENHRSVWCQEDFDLLAEEKGIKLTKQIWEQNGKYGCFAVFEK